jgi:hypothetical protein
MESKVPMNGQPIATIDQELGRLADRLRGAVRWSYWFSGLAWAFGIGVLIGLLIPYQTMEVTSSGTSSTSGPGYTAPAVFLALIVVLACSVLILVLARREALTGDTPGSSSLPVSRSEGGWVAAVQRAQKAVTRMKYVTEFSFLPLVWGTLLLGEWGISTLLPGHVLQSWWPAIGVVPVVLLAFGLYLTSRHWIGSFQARLDRQVGQLSHLEAEFFWRFPGTPG